MSWREMITSPRYVCDPQHPPLQRGDYLGELTSELDDDDHIVEFVSGGPKNYGYKTKNGKVSCKVRGFTLNVRGSQQLDYEVVKQNLLAELTDPLQDGERRNGVVNNPHFFTRHPLTKTLKVAARAKQYGVVFDKRAVDTNTLYSYPYGFSPFTDEDEEMAELLCEL